jgi:biotin carboxylase
MEQYLKGPQLSVEGFMIDGYCYLPAIFDRNYPYLNRFAPFMIEDGGQMPSKYSIVYKDECERVMTLAARSVGLYDGIVKGDLVIHEGLVKVIEIAGRMSGGWFGTVATPESTGVNLVKKLIRWSLGEKIEPKDMQPTIQDRHAAIRFAFPKPGIVKKLTGVLTTQKDKYCLYSRVFVRKGDEIKPTQAHPDRPAVVVAWGEERHSAILNAERLINKIRIETDGKD